MLDPTTRLPASGIAGFSDVDAAADPGAYIAFLDAFQRNLAPMIDAGIELLCLREGGSVLDLGCGHGAVFDRLAAKVGAAGHITGLDASRALLAEARRRCEARALHAALHEGDAHRLPFDDVAFDAARADRLLIFLRDPAAALAELARVTRYGGRIVVTEADLGSAVVDAPDADLTQVLLATAAEAVPNGWIGRRLRRLFVECGLADVEVRMFNAPSTSFAEWVRRIGIAPAARRAIELGRTSASAVDAWTAELEARDRAGHFFASSTFFTVSGTRSAAPVLGELAARGTGQTRR
jgi:SAM-dependent methyltransferase